MINLANQENTYPNLSGTSTNGLNLGGTSTGGLSAGVGGNFQDTMGQLLANGGAGEDILKDMDFAGSFSLENTKMDEKDVAFFLGLIDQNRLAGAVSASYMPSVEAQLANLSAEEVVKSSNVSKAMMELISKTQATNKPVRIDFDNDITLVLRVDREGKVNAQFFPGDKVAEEYLKNNIQYLRNRFDEQAIPYTEINYKNRQNQKEKKNRQKEQKDE